MKPDRETRRKAVLLAVPGLTDSEVDEALDLADRIMAPDPAPKPLPENVLPFKPRNHETKEKVL